MPFATCTLDSVFCIGVPVFSDLESFSGFIVDEFQPPPPNFCYEDFQTDGKAERILFGIFVCPSP